MKNTNPMNSKQKKTVKTYNLKKKVLLSTSAFAILSPTIVQPIHTFAETSETTPVDPTEPSTPTEPTVEPTTPEPSATETSEPKTEPSTEPTAPTEPSVPSVPSEPTPEPQPQPSEPEPAPSVPAEETPTEPEVDTAEEAKANYSLFESNLNLFEAIKYALGDVLDKRFSDVTESDFTNENLAKITYLNLSSGASTLAGVDKLSNLEELKMTYNKISDFSILKSLKNLKKLNVSNSKLLDFNTNDFPNVEINNSYNYSTTKQKDTIWVPESKPVLLSDWKLKPRMKLDLKTIFPNLNESIDPYFFKEELKRLDWKLVLENNEDYNIVYDEDALSFYISFKDGVEIPKTPVPFTISSQVFSTTGTLDTTEYPLKDENPTSNGEVNYALFDVNAIPSIEEELKKVTGKSIIEKTDFSTSNLEKIESLDVSGKGIRSLNGFEKMKGLQTLNVSDNLIDDYRKLLALSVTDLDISYNPVIIGDDIYESAVDVNDKGTLAVSDDLFSYRYDKIAFWSNKKHTFKKDTDTFEFTLSDLMTYASFDQPFSEEEFKKQTQKLDVDIRLTGDADKYYKLTYDKDTKIGKIEDLGNQPGKKFGIEIVYKGKAYSVGTLAPKKLNNKDLKDPVKNVWHNAYGLAVYEKESGKVYYAPDYNGADSVQYLAEGVNGIRDIDIKEGFISFVDNSGNLFLIDDSTNTQFFNPENAVKKIATGVRSFSVNDHNSAQNPYFILLKENGEIVRKMYTTVIRNGNTDFNNEETPEIKMTEGKFKNDFPNKETYSRYGRFQLVLTGEDGYMYYATSQLGGYSAPLDADGFPVDTQANLQKTPFKYEDVAGVYYANGDGIMNTIVSLKNGKTYTIKELYYDAVVVIDELPVSNVVDAKEDVLLTSEGDVYRINYDFNDSSYPIQLEKSAVKNAKKIVSGYKLDANSLFYLTKDNEAVYVSDMFNIDNSNSEVIDTNVNDILYHSPNTLLVKTSTGNYKLYAMGWDGMYLYSVYEDYNLAYLGGLASENPPVVVPPVVTPPTEPTEPTEPTKPTTPPVVTEPPVVVSPVVPPVVTEPPVVVPPIVTPEPTVPPVVTVPPVITEPTKPTEPTVPPVDPEPSLPPVVTPEEPEEPETPEPPVVIPEEPTEPTDDNTEEPVKPVTEPEPTEDTPVKEEVKEPVKPNVVYQPVMKVDKPVSTIEKDLEETLPQTGEERNSFVVWFGILFASVGALLLKGKRKKNA